MDGRRLAGACIVAAATMGGAAAPARPAVAAAPPPAVVRVVLSTRPLAAEIVFSGGDARAALALPASAGTVRLIVPLRPVGLGPYRRGQTYRAHAPWASAFAFESVGGSLALVVDLRRPLVVAQVGGRGLVLTIGLAPPYAPRVLSMSLFGHVAVAPAPPPSLAEAAPRAPEPVRAVPTTYGVDFKPRPLPRYVRLPVGAGGGGRTAAYATRIYGGHVVYLLAPAGARATALVGADGSFGIRVRLGRTVLFAQSDGPCYGCALGHAAGFFPALARLARKEYGFGAAPVPLTRLRGLVAYRYLRPRLVVYAFRDADGAIVEGFVAAPMTYKASGLVYAATWVGPAARAATGASELAVALASLSATG